MANLLATSATWFRYFLFLLATGLIIYVLPKTGKVHFDYEKGEPWQNKQLEAPFQFPIKKSPEKVKEEKDRIRAQFKPYYRKVEGKVIKIQQKLKEEILPRTYEEKPEKPGRALSYYQEKAEVVLKKLYDEGIINIQEKHQDDDLLRYVKKNKVKERRFSKFLTLQEARNQLKTLAKKVPDLNNTFFIKSVVSALEPNIQHAEDLSEKKLAALLDDVSVNRGLVQEGETVISRGEVVDEETYLILQSLEEEYEQQIGQGAGKYLLYGGYSLLVVFIMAIFGVYLNFFKKDVFRSTKSLLLLLINIVVFVAISAYVDGSDTLSIYIIPYAIVPIILLAFFGPRVAIMAHLVIVMVVGLFVGDGLEFIFLQIMAGFMSILAMSKIRYLSQFFIASILIVFSYYINFIGLKFIEFGSFQEIEWTNLFWFTGNFILTLLAYPLIYAHEKLFAFITDITLIEYADINKKVLRRLSMKAPGTFQHSLQVANISETVLNEIGGNALLARVGALYHDIGKMDNPEYFIENQQYVDNPHNNLSYEDSARVIISHVPKGIEKARQAGLPEQITKFIRTHHGSSRVEYFYRNYLKQFNNEEEVDENKFRYPGPKPFSKETAVVMLVDSVEAASRSKQEPTEQEVDDLINGIIDAKIKDNQLEKADITMREINIIRNRLKRLMKSIYHVRVKYPDEKQKADVS